MFIKWRVYQRQIRGEKIDKYIMQPILATSYRVSKGEIREYLMDYGMDEQEFEDGWKGRGLSVNRPRHSYKFKFPSFPSCAYVHYDEPQFIEQRKDYWTVIDALLESEMFSDTSEADKRMIVDEIERILPRPTDELLKSLEHAYSIGMPKSRSPKVDFDEGENILISKM